MTKPTAFETVDAVMASPTGFYKDGIVVELVDGQRIQYVGPTYVLSAGAYRALMLSE